MCDLEWICKLCTGILRLERNHSIFKKRHEILYTLHEMSLLIILRKNIKIFYVNAFKNMIKAIIHSNRYNRSHTKNL